MFLVGAALCQSGRQWDDTFCPPARLLYHFWGESLRKYWKKMRDCSQVMECGWATLQRQIQRAESLDEMVEAHHQFLDTLIARLVCINYHGWLGGFLVTRLAWSWPRNGNVELESHTGLCLMSDHGSFWPSCGLSMTGDWKLKIWVNFAINCVLVASHLWQVIKSWKLEIWVKTCVAGFWSSRPLPAGSTKRQWWSGMPGRLVFSPQTNGRCGLNSWK